MELIDNTSKLLGDDLRRTIRKDTKIKMVVSDELFSLIFRGGQSCLHKKEKCK